jgi:2-iminobutanoate/2-iminopropanoate deaminase
MQAVQTLKAPGAIGPYSQATMMNNTLFISGTLGVDPVSGTMPEGFLEQAGFVFNNLAAILNAAGMGFQHVVKVTVYVKDLNDFASLNDIYARTFTSPYPARETVEVARLPKDAKIEISLIAMR